jgi:hypothetical protein
MVFINLSCFKVTTTGKLPLKEGNLDKPKGLTFFTMTVRIKKRIVALRRLP